MNNIKMAIFVIGKIAGIKPTPLSCATLVLEIGPAHTDSLVECAA
jgi:hypothetical protein